MVGRALVVYRRPPRYRTDTQFPYNEEVAIRLCERIAGGESVKKITAEKGFPNQSTVTRWLWKYEAFRQLYTQARRLQAETLMDELVGIADMSDNDFVEKVDKDGTPYMAYNREAVERSRLRVDARKWAITKLYPSKYGEKAVIEHQGAVGAFDISKMATDDLEQLERILSGVASDGGDTERD